MSGGTRSYEMARRLVRLGHEVHLVTTWRDEGEGQGKWFVTNEAGIFVYWYRLPYSNHMGFSARIKAFFSFALAATRKAIELNGDIIFATSTPLTIAIPGVYAARKHKVPLVFEVRDLWPEMPIAMNALKNPVIRKAALQLERWAYRNSDAVVALSPGMKEGIVRTGYPTSRVAVIPNSSDNFEFRFDSEASSRFRAKRDWLGDKPLLVYTGTFGKVNGLTFMVELAKALLNIGSQVQILLVGDGAERVKVINDAKMAGVYNVNLHVESELPKKEIPELLSAATMASSLFIDLPEMRANSANKFFDALAAGKPILLNYGGWMHDLVNKFDCGLAMWSVPIQVVADNLEKKMNDRSWLLSAGQSARFLAEKIFDRDDLANQLLSVLDATKQGLTDQVSQIAPGDYDSLDRLIKHYPRTNSEE